MTEAGKRLISSSSSTTTTITHHTGKQKSLFRFKQHNIIINQTYIHTYIIVIRRHRYVSFVIMSTATTENGKSILESNLGQLLGFDDGVSDILDHLLSIESREDLLEYLLQLLGDSTPELIDFVDNIGKHKNGESIAVSAAESSSRAVEDSKKLPPPASKKQQQSPEDYDAALMNGRQGSSPKRNKKKSKSPPRRKNNIQRQQQQSNKQNQKESTTSSSSATSSSLNPAQNNKSNQITTSKERGDITNEDDNPPVVVVKKSQPPKGEPKINCGCFGMKHKPLTNCLFCGRISCIKEGYDFCPFCGYLIEEIIKDPNQTYDDKAWIQKERLLRFDREFARRTEIFDDQADFQGPKTWMNEDEIAEAEEAEIRHLEKLKHPKQTLQLDI